MRNAILLAAFSALLVTSCKASVQVNANSPTDESVMEAKSAPAPVVSEAPKIPHTDFFGVARRLSIAPNQGQQAAVCSCLAVAVGNGSEPVFDWRGQPSDVGYDAMAVAISAEGIACPKAANGPSVRGFERHGDDVIVVVEEWHSSRPQAFGAIIPNPGPQGHVYVRSVGKSPYGRPIGAVAGTHHSWCRVGSGTAFDGYTPNTTPSDESESKPKSNGAYDEMPGSTDTGGSAPASAPAPAPAPAGN